MDHWRWPTTTRSPSAGPSSGPYWPTSCSARIALTALLATLVIAGAALPARADHTHVLLLGNGECVTLAAEGGEKDVQMPHADEFAENRQHPLHVNVHLGEPGTRGDTPVIFVQGSPEDLANCDGYINS